MSADRTFLDDALDAVLDLPLHRALGLRLRDHADPTAGLVCDVTPEIATPAGVLHGGLHGLLMDVTSLLVLAAELPTGAHAVTVSSNVSILAGAPIGSTVTTTAHLERAGRRLAFLSARVENGDAVIATGQFTKAVQRPR